MLHDCDPQSLAGRGAAVYAGIRRWGLTVEMIDLLLLRGRRAKALALSSALAALIAAPAVGQVSPVRPPVPVARKAQPVVAQPQPPVTPEGAVPGNPDFAPDQPQASHAAPVPAPLPPVLWTLPIRRRCSATSSRSGPRA